MKGALIVLLAAVAAGAVGCGKRAERAWAETEQVVEQAAEPRARVDALRAYLASYPDSEHATEAAEGAVYTLLEELSAPAEAEQLLAGLLPRLSDPEQLRSVSLLLVPTYGKLGKAAELKALAADLASRRPLQFPEAFDVAVAALDAAAPGLALEHLAVAERLATPEAYRAESPGRTLADDRVERTVKRRKAELYGAQACALARLGRPDEAAAALASGQGFESSSYLGGSATLYGRYRGEALLAMGRAREAVEALTPEVLYGETADVQKAFTTAFVSVNGSEAGVEAYLAAARERLARPVDDFTLADYEGKPHRFSELRGGQVTLLAFWFPT